ncbi:XdhC family protein [Streptomyces sp. AV19]|uniref:XdhC family protein n=1 Tax=Streptomyces sp. AV19 TaxID=2793068 RepID=UPI0018FE5A65|nr:XdhC/CoxI family protein [Streptomyces sp. AV19]MBH1938399.1 XdhC family protein [Streptomyces sp. AV19]MDG4535048.1 XdhC family protein [Streptomyces sp. AV19]
MLDLAEELHRWCAEGRDFAVATVTAVHGSAPRQPGASLAVDADGTAVGSVSGGCVEGAVHELCLEALETGRGTAQRFGYSDEDAFAVGLTCGGVLDVLVTPVGAAQRPLYEAAFAAVVRGEATAVARPADGSAGVLVVHADGTSRGAAAGLPEAAAFLAAGRTGTVEAGCERTALFVESSAPPPRMIVFGAVDFAAALVRAGKFLGYRVTVCDARPVFATRRRFPEADEVVVDWPHRYLDGQRVDSRTVLCVLTHDEKFDVPLLERALRLPAAYVGAMGSRRTHAARLRRLREAGLGEDELARLRSPIGLDLGGRTPEETALSIAAEIVAVLRGGSGAPLTGAGVPIHREAGPWGSGDQGEGGGLPVSASTR